MTHAEVCEQVKLWHQVNFSERTIHPNRTGVAMFDKRAVPYGLPAPSMRKRLKRVTGGGPDFYSIGTENGVCSFWGIECKTLHDTVKPNQRKWADYMVLLGARYYIARETVAGGVEYSRYYPDNLSLGDPTPP
jgi:hypothetical protein